MGKLPPIKTFRGEDFPGVPANFLDKLSGAMEAVFTTLKRYVNFENISGQMWERQVLLKGTSVSPSAPFLLPYDHIYPPAALVLGGIWIKGTDSKTSIGSVVTLEWDYDPGNKQIIIKAVNGLSQPFANDYQITLFTLSR